MEADKAINQQTGAERGYETILGGSKVRVRGGTGSSDTSVKDERYDGQKEVDVEERCDFFSACYSLVKGSRPYTTTRQRTDSCELGAHMDNHDDCHYHGQDMHEIVRGLEDERVRNLNRPRIAPRLNAHAIVDRLVTHKGT